MIQLPQSAFQEFDDLVRYEDMLIDVLANAHDVDGHDMGSGEVNFYVLTDDPTVALCTIRDAGDGSLLSHLQVRAAARLMDGEGHEPLGPVRDEREFTIV